MAMKNGRCRMHGGKSTGPISVEGRARIAAARTRHGGYTPQARQLFRGCAGILARGKALLELVGRDVSDPGEIRRALLLATNPAVTERVAPADSRPANSRGRRKTCARPGVAPNGPRVSGAKNPMRREPASLLRLPPRPESTDRGPSSA
jgi:hypothetical protein